MDQLAPPVGPEVEVDHDVAVTHRAIYAGNQRGLHEFVALTPGIRLAIAGAAEAASGPLP